MKKVLFLLFISILFLVGCGNKEINLTSDATMGFGDFTFEIKKAEVTERDGNSYLKLDTVYTNDSFPAEKSFMAAALFYVKQGDHDLNEVTEVTTDPSSNYYYKNNPGIEAPIEFEYELKNTEDVVVINVNPNNEYEDTGTYRIVLPEE